jgi:hypothetical protein
MTMDESKHAAKVDWLVGWLVVAVVVDDMTSKYNLSNIQVDDRHRSLLLPVVAGTPTPPTPTKGSPVVASPLNFLSTPTVPTLQ